MGILGDFAPFFSYSSRMEYHPKSCLCNVRPINMTRAQTDYMKKFYAVPANQEQLHRCIDKTKVEIQNLEMKIKDLEEYSTKFIKTTNTKSLNLKLITKISPKYLNPISER